MSVAVLAALVAVLLTGCQDTARNPATWTLNEVHADIGLVGGHQVLGCPDCHGQAALKAIPGQCEDCHLAEYDEVASPNHKQAGYPTQCIECHTSTAWRPTSYDHDVFGFSLLGAHATVVCGGCHPAAEPLGELPTDCYACHEADYRLADPDHVVLGLDTDCEVCHTSIDWTSSFDHEDTGYALVGAHATADCVLCHAPSGEALVDVPTDCYACHEADYAEAAPDHVLLELGTTCETCHTAVDWSSTFDHGATEFPLLGVHITTDCLACHAPDGEALADVPIDCYTCHEADYDEAEPDHALTELATACQDCHTSVDWESSFDHSDTEFPLTGAHITTDCLPCHAPAGVALGELSADCFACHEPAFRSAVPDHVALEFSTDCQDCHSSVDWRSDSFDHDVTEFALRGAHTDVDCLTCHTDGFVDTQSDCISCHADDEPQNHFGPDCADCHTDVAWTPSTFDHELKFPIRAGNHRKYENDCAACHLDTSDYAVFTCTDCHDNEHERRDMDDEHDDVNEYRYDSVACFDCHPRGNEDDAED